MAGCGSGGQPSSRRAERMGFVGWVTAPGPRQYRSAPCVCVYVDTLCRRAEPQPPPGGAAAPWGRCALPEPCRPRGKWGRLAFHREQSGSDPAGQTAVVSAVSPRVVIF